MTNLELLILDDDTDNLDEYKNDIEIFNLSNKEYNFNTYYCETLEDAFKTLNKNSIDFSIVDLRLTDGHSGNDLVNKIIESYQIPTQIITGFPNDFDSKIEKNLFVSIMKRGDKPTNDILNKFLTFAKYGVSKIFSKEGVLNTSIKDLFWNYMPQVIENCNYSINPDSLIRFCANYLKESMTYNSEGHDLPYQPFEFYSIPSITNSMQCGSIFEYDGDNYINLTPACDIAQDKTLNYQIIKIVPFEELTEIQKIITKDYSSDKKIEDAIRRLINNNTALKYHCLPPHGKFKGGIVNFQTVTSVEKNTIIENCIIIGNINSEFLKDITARFGSYFSRQGQPSISELLALHKSLNINKE